MSAGGRSGLAHRDEHLRELMDEPDCDPERLAATLRRFGAVNRLISGWGTVYRDQLRPFLRTLGRPARVLDLGSGGGDVIARLDALAHRDGLDVAWVGVDPDPRAHTVASARAGARTTFLCADSSALLSGGERFDAVLSNHVLHHLERDELHAFVEASAALSSGIVLHSDIARSRAAYALYAVGITPLAPGTFLRTDGLRSIRRSYHPDELARALPAGWRVQRPAPFRVLATRLGHA